MSNEPQLVDYFSKHTLGLAATQIHGDQPIESAFFVVGLVVSIKSEWFLVTAGHCLADIEEANNFSKLENYRLVDYMGSQAKEKSPIPFDYTGSFKQYCYDTRSGFDAGFVHIKPYYRHLLAVNGIVAHDEVQWKRQPEKFEAAWMMGIPASTVRRRDQESYWFSTSMIPLDIGHNRIHPAEVPRRFRCRIDGSRAVAEGRFVLRPVASRSCSSEERAG